MWPVSLRCPRAADADAGEMQGDVLTQQNDLTARPIKRHHTLISRSDGVYIGTADTA